MQVTTVSVKIDRKTGTVIETEYEGIEEVNETEFYRPLVEVFYKAFSEQAKKAAAAS